MGALCLSFTAIVVKVAGVDAATTAVLRCALALVPLLPLALRERRRRGALSVRGMWWALAAGAALGLDYAAWTASIYHVGAGMSTVLINVQVIVLPLLAFAVDREQVPRRFLAMTPVMLGGIALVGGVAGGPTTVTSVTGTTLGVAAGVGYAIYLFLTRRTSRVEPRRAIQQLTWATVAATVAAAVVAPLSGGVSVSGISPRQWWLLATLAGVGQVLSWLLIHYGSARLTAARTSALLLTQPILAVALAAVILGEHPTALQLAGVVLVLCCVAVVTDVWRTRRP